MPESVPASRVARYAGLAAFIFQFENCMTATALPVMYREVPGLAGVISLVPAAYLVGATMAMVPAGRLAMRVGFHLVLGVALTVMALGMLLSACAPEVVTLILGRWISGLGGGAMAAAAYGMVAVCVAGDERRGVMGWISMGAGLGMLAGSPLGGFIAEALSWRGLFASQIPVLAVVAVLMFRLNVGERTDSSLRPGWARSIFFGVGATCACLAGTLGRERGWLSPEILALQAAALVIFVLFIVSEQKTAMPLYPRAIWQARGFWPFWGLLTACTAALGATFFLVPFYLHDVVGLTVPVAAGWMIVQVVTYSLAAMTAGRLQKVVRGERQALAGALLVLAGASLYFLGVVRMAGPVGITAACALMGGGFGLLFPAVNAGCVARLPEEHRGTGASLLPLGSNLGSITGVILAGEMKEWHLQVDGARVYDQAFLAIIVPLLIAAGGFWYLGRKNRLTT